MWSLLEKLAFCATVGDRSEQKAEVFLLHTGTCEMVQLQLHHEAFYETGSTSGH